MKNTKSQLIEQVPPKSTLAYVAPKEILPEHGTCHEDQSVWLDDDTVAIAARTDFEAIRAFLSEYHDEPNTYRRFAKELERLLLWMSARNHAHGQRLTLRKLKLEHINEYMSFLQNPDPSWCGPKRSRHLKDNSINPQWRPFVKGLSDSSLNTARACLCRAFGWLCEAGYLKYNAFRLRRNKKVERQLSGLERKRQVEGRLLGDQLRAALLESLEIIPEPGTAEEAKYERRRYLFHLFMYAPFRLSEAASHRMSDFDKLEGSDSWTIYVTGKGSKQRYMVIPDKLVAALSRYRMYLGLPALPSSSETDIPIISALNNYRKAISTRQVHNIIKELLYEAADLIEHNSPDQAKLLRSASAHWFRHTNNTLMERAGASRRERMLNAGHADEKTAQIYEHTELIGLAKALKSFEI